MNVLILIYHVTVTQTVQFYTLPPNIVLHGDNTGLSSPFPPGVCVSVTGNSLISVKNRSLKMTALCGLSRGTTTYSTIT